METDTSIKSPACDHGITFDKEKAKDLTVSEIKKQYPRLDGECPKKCGYSGIYYASWAHFVYGDW